MNTSLISGLTRTACLALLLSACAVEQPEEPTVSSSPEDSLRSFLRNYDDYKSTRYLRAFVDLNDDGKDEAIVYLLGPWCGSGGCTMLILTPEDNTYGVITKTTITNLPIRVLSRSSHGWRSIGVAVQGGGILQGYEAELTFDGNTYPSNPTVPPAHPLTEETAGEAVIDSSALKDAKPLYADY